MAAATLEEYIVDYKKQAAICAAIDYTSKPTVIANNKAVTKMYTIVQKVKADFGAAGVASFAQLLDITENDTCLWAAIHLLERVGLDKKSEAKALQIIKRASADNLGLQLWLKNYQSKSF